MRTFPVLPCALALASAFLFGSCSGLPAIHPSDPGRTAAIVQQCRQPFPDRPYRFVHSIETSLSGRTGTLLGITLLDPKTRRLRSAILTLEGMVLFEAVRAEKTDVIRAVPPFTSPHFAENMMNDIRLVYFAPEGRLLKTGRLADGSAACRYAADGNGTIDVVLSPGDSWQINAYGVNGQKLRAVRASAVRDGIPQEMNLTGFSATDYSLKMNLISAEQISPGAF